MWKTQLSGDGFLPSLSPSPPFSIRPNRQHCSAGLDLLSPLSHHPAPPRLRVGASLSSPPLLCIEEERADEAVRAASPALLPQQNHLINPDEPSPFHDSSSSDDETEHSFPPQKHRIQRRKENRIASTTTVAPSQHSNVQALAHRVRNAASLIEGRKIHSNLKAAGLDQDTYLANLLILMFHKFNDLPSAHAVFDALKYPSAVSWNCIMRSYIKFNRKKEALQLFRQMLQRGHRPSRTTFITILGACISPENLAEGKWIHAYIDKHRLRKDSNICNSLITMFNRCGDLKQAVLIFENMQNRTVVSWNAAIAAYCKQGDVQRVLDLFARMQQEGMQPDQRTFVSMLNAFNSPACLADGKEIHNCILDHGFHRELIVGNALISMYRKCGSPDDALFVFEQMEEHDVISWTALIDAYAENGHGKEALKIFQEMQEKGVKPNRVTFISALSACAVLEDAEEGKSIHSLIKDSRIPIDVYLGNALIYMYEKGGALTLARTVFDEMHERDTVSWTIMLHAYASHKHAEEALHLFKIMQENKLELGKPHFISALDACGLLSNLNEGKALHEHIHKREFLSDNTVANALICMYGRCGALNEACRIFESMRHRDIVSWNAMITMYANWNHRINAFDCFTAMQKSGVAPNKLTFLGLLTACTSANALLEGKELHRNIMEYGLDKEVLLCSALINMYGNCGAVEEALAVFESTANPDLSSWNVLMGAYCNSCNPKGALDLFRRMQENNVKPNKGTYLNVLGACTAAGAQEFGETVHELVKDSGWGSDVVIGGALINMYGKFRDLKSAQEVFENMDDQNVVSWTAMIDAYGKQGRHKEARELLKSMQQNNCEPNKITLASVLGSCTSPTALDDGTLVHSFIIDVGFETDLFLGNTLVAMYGKCQALDFACQAFHRTGQHDVVSWTALMSAFLRCQKYAEVLQLFEQMQVEVQPNQVTFICAIRACTSLKSLAEGKEIHAKVMESVHASDISVKQALIDMYHSCSAFEDLYSLTS